LLYEHVCMCFDHFQEKILPPSPITTDEKKQTLSRLSQIIEHRIVTVDLPRHMCQPHIGEC